MKTTVVNISSFRHRENILNEWSVCPKLHLQSLITGKGLVEKLFWGCFEGKLKDRGVRQGKRKKWKLGGNPQLQTPAYGGPGHTHRGHPIGMVLSLTHSGEFKEACHSFWLGPYCSSPAHIHTQESCSGRLRCCPSTLRYKCWMLKIKTLKASICGQQGEI